MVGPDESEARGCYIVVVSSAGTITTGTMAWASGPTAWTGTCQRAVRFDAATCVPVMPRRRAERAQPRVMIDPWMPRAPAPTLAAAWPVQIRRFRGNT